MRTKHFFTVCGVALASACSEIPAPTPVEPLANGRLTAISESGEDRYVAIGTSISMGWQSGGVFADMQSESWPARLTFTTQTDFTLPLIQSPGCVSPLVAPLGEGRRLSGESAAGSVVCAANEAGVALPAQNVAIAGARAIDALTTASPGPASAPWYARVLPSGATQLTAALSQQPTVISVELGGNEVLGVTTGLFAPGVTIVPFPFFAGPVTAILNAIAPTDARVLLFEMPTNAANLPALRLGDEIWNDREDFAALHVAVNANCENSPNYINVSIKALNAVFEGAFRRANGLPMAAFSCADIPGTPDLVLTPADIAATNALMAQMRTFVQQQAAARGYAVASLGALFDREDVKQIPYSIVRHLTSSHPFGPFFSLDGVHPSELGHGILAREAERGFRATYGTRFANAVATSSVLTHPEPDALVSRALALELARTVAAQNRHERLSPCLMPGECAVDAPRR